MYENRQYLIFNVSELPLIDFLQVLETSSSTLRFSVDNTKTFVKWDSVIEPSFVNLLTSKEGPYSYDEILSILSTPEWLGPMPEHMIVT